MTGPARRRRRMPILPSSAALFGLLYLLLRFGIQPPIPMSVLGMYMFIIGVSVLLYVSADAERFREFKAPMLSLILDPRHRIPRVALAVALPLIAGAVGFSAASRAPAPPGQQRTIHPAPPSEIVFRGKTINVLKAENPFRHLEREDPAAFRRQVERGREVYYQNCVFCHGDTLEGDGLFAHGFDPIPANLADPGTIAQLQESYLFWRIAKGGRGLPAEATPWNSAMPVWEQFLSEDEIWQVILFLYDFTHAQPREWE